LNRGACGLESQSSGLSGADAGECLRVHAILGTVRAMRFAVGLLLVAACATKSAPPPASVEAARSEPAARTRPSRALTPDVVLATIRGRYLGGVERCYRRHLKRDASARGRVLVAFTVDARGRARDGDAHGITAQITDCIEAQMRRWRFPRPRREERFALGLVLAAD
jgi:hypothetical protein